ncbi:hypothetical protein B0I37DRAFT_425635 [Chaetomium sp. MPI-CAGE-AT-0009]|nr:hypothetical protein B0I37DRAFT_425635 [Chaetomium sp. MPI-CAGE-AT-0009]
MSIRPSNSSVATCILTPRESTHLPTITRHPNHAEYIKEKGAQLGEWKRRGQEVGELDDPAQSGSRYLPVIRPREAKGDISAAQYCYYRRVTGDEHWGRVEGCFLHFLALSGGVVDLVVFSHRLAIRQEVFFSSPLGQCQSLSALIHGGECRPQGNTGDGKACKAGKLGNGDLVRCDGLTPPTVLKKGNSPVDGEKPPSPTAFALVTFIASGFCTRTFFMLKRERWVDF